MMKKKIIMKAGLLMAAVSFVASASRAQSLEDGKKLFFYERYVSAQKVFTSLSASGTEAIYWLGQAELAQDDSAGVTALYQKAAMDHPGDPLLLVGLGHLELLAGQAQDARQRFETAISLTKGKSIPVLNAIGFANVDAPAGDANYAIDKLKQATTLKGFKDPDVYINLGDAYRKLVNGGAAQLAYQSAAQLDRASPRPLYKIGKIYESQGASQADLFVKDYEEAILKDSTFGPAYYALYVYYYRKDINKSREYLDKFIAHSDPDHKDCYYQASVLFASGLYQQSLDKTNECLAADGDHPYPNLLGLKGYNYFALGDSVNAKNFFEQYFEKQKPAKVGPADYATYAKILLKFPGNDSLANTYIDKAIAQDSLEADKINEAKILLDYYTKTANDSGIGNAYKKIIAARKQPVNSDFQTGGYYFYRAGNFAAAAALFDSATVYFPTDVYDYYMLGKSSWGVDTNMQQGLANSAFQKVIDLADTVTYKAQLIGAYKYFVQYYANIKADKVTALDYCDKILALDPADAETLKNKELISKMKSKPAK